MMHYVKSLLSTAEYKTSFDHISRNQISDVRNQIQYLREYGLPTDNRALAHYWYVYFVHSARLDDIDDSLPPWHEL